MSAMISLVCAGVAGCKTSSHEASAVKDVAYEAQWGAVFIYSLDDQRYCALACSKSVYDPIREQIANGSVSRQVGLQNLRRECSREDNGVVVRRDQLSSVSSEFLAAIGSDKLYVTSYSHDFEAFMDVYGSQTATCPAADLGGELVEIAPGGGASSEGQACVTGGLPTARCQSNLACAPNDPSGPADQAGTCRRQCITGGLPTPDQVCPSGQQCRPANPNGPADQSGFCFASNSGDGAGGNGSPQATLEEGQACVTGGLPLAKCKPTLTCVPDDANGPADQSGTCRQRCITGGLPTPALTCPSGKTCQREDPNGPADQYGYCVDD